MKWFEHRTTDRNELEARQIKHQFGLEGYGIWLSLIEVIGELMENDNVSEWGYVPVGVSMTQLAEKTGCPEPKFRDFVTYCDQQLILEQRGEQMFCQYILDRMNEYAQRIHAKESRKSKKTESTKSTEIPETTKKPVSQHNHNTITTQSQHNTKTERQDISAPTVAEDPLKLKKESLALEASELITQFNLKFGKSYQLTDTRKAHIRARLKRFSAEQLARAVDALANSPFHTGQNSRNWVADPDFLFKNDEQVDKFLNLTGKPVEKKGVLAQWIEREGIHVEK